MMGKLIVIEGTDASGKSTQFSLLCSRLEAQNIKFKRLSFPQYDKPSSTLIRMYLNGDFGKNPGDVNAYAASTFFAVDRYASFKQDWKKDFETGAVILCDRYATSNAIHQGAKLDSNERGAFLDWICDFEFKLLGLPPPDKVFFLDMPVREELMLLKNRIGKKADIHETDENYLKTCYETALFVSESWKWTRVRCVKDGKIRTADDIHGEIYELTMNLLGGKPPHA